MTNKKDPFDMQIRKIRRRKDGATYIVFRFSFLLARKVFICEHDYATERSCENAGKKFLAKYIK